MIKKIFTLSLLALSLAGYAQKIKLVEGSLAPLKGQKSVNTQFTYDNMLVTDKDTPEKDYLEKKKKEYNEKEPGRGEKFEQAWFNDRKERFEPQFRELFAKESGWSSVDEKAPYTVIFHTTHTEIGFNIGIAKKNAYIDAEVIVVETANPSKVIARFTMMNIPGRQFGGMDFETGVRLQEAYAKAGKEVAHFIVKQAK